MVDIAKLGIEIDSKGAKKGADDLEQLSEASDRATESASKLGAAMGKLAKIAAGSFSAAAIGKFLGSSVKEAEMFEQSMLRTQAIIKATGGVAGKSAEGLREQAKAMSRATLESTEGVERAQQTLLTFRKVQGDVFDRTIKAAADMSAALGGDLNASALMLGKALENPTQGLSALTETGTVFTEQQKKMVKGMIEAGDIAKAQVFILAELEAQYGGTAEAVAQGLSGTLDGLGQSWQELKLSVAESFGLAAGAVVAFGALDQALQFVAGNMDTIAGMVTAVATGLTVYFAPAIVAGTVATGAFVASLITLKGTLLATGIGAVVIAAGWLLGKLFELVRATGGWGNALTLLGDVARGVWEGIKTSASSIPPALGAVWATIEAGFIAMIEALSRKWANFLHAISAGMQNIPGMESAANYINGEAIVAGSYVYELGAAVTDAKNRADELSSTAKDLVTSGFDEAAAAAGKLKTAVQDIPTVNPLGIPDMPGTPTTPTTPGTGAVGGGGTDQYAASLQKLTDSLQTERETVDAWYVESQAILADRRAQDILGEEGHRQAMLSVEQSYQDQLAAIRDQGREMERAAQNAALSEAAGLLGLFAGKSKAAAVAAIALNKGLRIAEIIQNTAAAQMRAFAELGPIAGAAAAAKIGIWGKVQAGIVAATGLVSMSQAGGGGGGSGGGAIGSIAAQGTAAQAAPQAQSRLIIQGLKADDIFTGKMLFDMLGEESEKRGIEFMGAT